MIRNITKLVLTLSLILVIATSCKEDEPLPQILAGFSSTSLGLSLTDDNGTVAVEISRTDGAATTITLNITEGTGTAYGVDYTTEPAAVAGEITLEIASGSTSANLVVNKLKNPEFGEVKSFTVDIADVGNGGTAGTNATLAVTFEENPVSAGAQMNPEVGGPEQPNQVYIDLSKQNTTAVAKDAWDLGFYTGADNRVILNYATYAMAKVTDQTDLANVTDVLVTPDYMSDMTPGQPGNTGYMDDPAGDLSKTTIAAISTTASENMVYVLNRGFLDTKPDATPLGYMKFKIDMNGSDYVITYGAINDVDGFGSVTIAKDTDFNFVYFSFANGVVSIEPKIAEWDIAMTTFLSEYPDGQGNIYSYQFPDYVLTNYGHVQVTSVAVTTEVTYDSFTAADLSTVTLEDNRLGIKNSWRGFDFNTYSYYLKDDIFYIVQDTDGNNYKLKFTAMFNNSGERGYPEFIYELLK